MIDDLQTLCTAALRRHYYAVAADATTAAEDDDGFEKERPPPPIVDPRAVDVFFESLTIQDNPGLQCESAWALVVVADSIISEQQRNVVAHRAVVTLCRLRRRRSSLSSMKEDVIAKANEAFEQIVAGCSETCRACLVQLLARKIVAGIEGGIPGRRATQLSRTAAMLRRILSETASSNSSIHQVLVKAGVVPALVEFLRHRDDDPALQCESAWIVARSIHHSALSSPGDDIGVNDVGTIIIPAFVRLLRRSSSNPAVARHAAKGLACIASSNDPNYRELVLQNGEAVPPLLELLRHRPHGRRAATKALSGLCRSGVNVPRSSSSTTTTGDERLRPILRAMTTLIHIDDDEAVLADACAALTHLTSEASGMIQDVIDSGACPRLVELLAHSSPAVHAPAIRAVGNISLGSHRQAKAILDQDPLPSLLPLLSSPHSRVREMACGTAYNLAFRSHGRVQVVIDSGIISPIIRLLSDHDHTVRKQAVKVVRHYTTKASTDQIKAIVDKGCIPALCELLADYVTASGALTSLTNILHAGYVLSQQCGTTTIGASGAASRTEARMNAMAVRISAAGGVSKLLEVRQRHRNHAIRRLSSDLLERYFGIGEGGG